MPLLERCAVRLAWMVAWMVALTAGLGVAAVLGLGPVAMASIGVGVQADPVRLASVARPGGSYPLPSLYVVNTGTEAESLSIQVKRLSAGPGQPIPASWIQIGNVSGNVGPGQQVLISLELVAPADAKPGRYRSDIVVTGAAADSTSASGMNGSSGVRFGVAAATALQFSIGPAPAQQGWFGLPVWKWWLTGILALLAVVIVVVRRTGLRIRVETNTRGDRYGM
jgi:hypothetical protein